MTPPPAGIEAAAPLSSGVPSAERDRDVPLVSVPAAKGERTLRQSSRFCTPMQGHQMFGPPEKRARGLVVVIMMEKTVNVSSGRRSSHLIFTADMSTNG